MTVLNFKKNDYSWWRNSKIESSSTEEEIQKINQELSELLIKKWKEVIDFNATAYILCCEKCLIENGQFFGLIEREKEFVCANCQHSYTDMKYFL